MDKRIIEQLNDLFTKLTFSEDPKTGEVLINGTPAKDLPKPITFREIAEKLTECIRISDRVSIWNVPGLDEENPNPMKGIDMIDNIIVDILKAIDPDWKRPG